MKRAFWLLLLAVAVAGLAAAQYGNRAAQSSAPPGFSITASYIEACSCDMFCPCYFNEHATRHGNAHFCKFNNVLRVDKGSYKGTNLAGVKAWLAGDLGPNWGKGQADWLVIMFDPMITKAQEEAMLDILPQLYPMKWKVLGVEKIPIEWNVDTSKGIAAARLGNGKGEVILEKWKGDNPGRESVLQNVKYWAAQSNTGFRMWKNKRHYYEGYGQKIEYSGTNGFLITINFSGQPKS